MSAMASPYGCRNVSRAGLAVVVVLHLLAFWALLRTNVIRLPIPPEVLTVALLTPHEEIRPPEPPRPVRKRPEPVPQPVWPAAPEEAPAPVVVPPSPAAPPAPSFVEASPPALVEIVKPRFDADYFDNPKPVYPALARRMGEEGKVVLRVQVAASGLPADVTLHASSGSARLDQAAIEAVRRWKFVPARRGDEAVAAVALVPIVFSLKE